MVYILKNERYLYDIPTTTQEVNPNKVHLSMVNI